MDALSTGLAVAHSHPFEFSAPNFMQPLPQPMGELGVSCLPYTCRLARACLLEPWVRQGPAKGHEAAAGVTPSQLLTCLRAAELYVSRLQGLLAAALIREGAPPPPSADWSEAVGALVALLAQLRGTCEHQPGWDGAALATAHSPEAALAATQAALHLAALLVRRWAAATQHLGAGAPVLLQELLFTCGALPQWAAGMCTSGGSSSELLPSRVLTGVGVASAAAQLVVALAGLPPWDLQALAATLHCDLRSELSSVLASAVGAAVAGAGVVAEGALGEGAPSLLSGQLDPALGQCAEAAGALVGMQLPPQPHSAAHCTTALAWMRLLLRRHDYGLAAAAGLEGSLASIAQQALAFQPSNGMEFSLAGSTFQSLREAVKESQKLGHMLATGGFLAQLVAWAEQVVWKLKKSTSTQMVLALRPAKQLVADLAAAVLREAQLGQESQEYRSWAKFCGIPDKKLRGSWLWQTAAREIVAWAARAA